MNFTQALRMRRVEFRPSTKPNEIWMCCPFCSDGRFRLGVNLRTGEGHCFNCNWSSRKNSHKLIGDKLKTGPITGAVGANEKKKQATAAIALPKDFVLLWDVRADSMHAYQQAWSYAKTRGLSDRQIVDKKIGVSLVGKYAYRLIFPIYRQGRMKGMVCRDFTGRQKIPYLNSDGEKGLYNLPGEKDRAAVAILVEGVFDCLALERALGSTANPLAMLGHDLTDLQHEQLKWYRHIVLWPDKDKPGIDGMAKVASRLSSTLYRSVYWIEPNYVAKDPGELPISELSLAYRMQKRPWSADLSQKWKAKMAFAEA